MGAGCIQSRRVSRDMPRAVFDRLCSSSSERSYGGAEPTHLTSHTTGLCFSRFKGEPWRKPMARRVGVGISTGLELLGRHASFPDRPWRGRAAPSIPGGEHGRNAEAAVHKSPTRVGLSTPSQQCCILAPQSSLKSRASQLLSFSILKITPSLGKD